nr:basic salivary proline-rich protein 3 [Macaca nemestrina]
MGLATLQLLLSPPGAPNGESLAPAGRRLPQAAHLRPTLATQAGLQRAQGPMALREPPLEGEGCVQTLGASGCSHTWWPYPRLEGQLQPIPGIGRPDKPEAGQLDQPRSQPTPKQGAQGTPTKSPSTCWKAPPRPGLALRKESPPVTSEQEQGQNKGLVTEWAQPQATAAGRAGAGKPGPLKLRPWQAGRDPQAQEGAVVTEEDLGQKAGGREDKGRGLKPRRPPQRDLPSTWAKDPAPTEGPQLRLGWQRQHLQDPGPWVEKTRKHTRAQAQAREPGHHPAGHALSAGLVPPGPGSHRLWQRQDEACPCPDRPWSDHTLPGRWVASSPRTHPYGRGKKADTWAPTLALPSSPVWWGRYRVAAGRGQRIWLPHVRTENEIAKIPAHTFLGLPNLEWLDLSKNKLDPRGLHPHAFKLCCGPFTCSWGAWAGVGAGRSQTTHGIHSLQGGAAWG